ncbi:ABC transporter substrate-binding protein [Dactylosporangium matsuzakiense]|uniref:Branched-chain amino acid ABC transporter n=1 Tax=Dactylosporangium matsuzakiense TaxID=53360 RepID=A0A9W6KXL3_9ACTN|nr:ABC transporter substrate-binding protein [Dactylosporangium matsuzakiense]GLL07314.1 branched-chain amino acid ABC transporter [Dactylosporangium matsuzakiense]
MLAAVSLTSTSACTSVNEKGQTNIVVAASLELSGSAADIGVAYQRALELKAAQINASGLLGERRLTVKVQDNRGDPATALTQITAFTADPDVTAIITGTCGDCTSGAAKVINEHKVPTIALSPVADVIAPAAERKYIFRLAPSADDDAVVLAGELSRAGQRKVALLGSDDAYGRHGVDALTREAGKITGAKVVARGQFAPAESDLSKAAKAALTGSPDAVVIWGYPQQAALAVGAVRSNGYHGQVYLDAVGAGDLFLGPPFAGTDATSLVFTPTLAIDDVIATTPAKAARRQWFQDYTSRYGTYHGHASFAADALQLIANAVAQSGTAADGAALRARLETAQVDGLSGPIRFTPDNHSGLTPQSLAMLEARGGRWRLLG